MKHSDIIEKLTLEEKAGLCDGDGFWFLKSIDRLGIPKIMVCDGPHGLRKKDPESEKISLGGSVPAVCFPTSCTTACSWDPDLLYEMGEALADKCLKEKVSVILGPGTNMKRSPLCGRNFEYFSEDPYLAGKMAAGLIKGIQSKGVGTSLKHFAANTQETRRMTVNSVVDERALREIYLTAFEIAVKEAKPWTVMNAYNRLNGDFCSENNKLQNEILRDEWGFDGVVVSDWGAVSDRVKGLKAGNDLEMPSSFGINQKKIIAAIESGELDEKILDERVDNILELILKSAEKLGKEYSVDEDAQHELARKIASQSMVLLKNEDNILPLKADAKIALIGEMAKTPRYQGAGSSLINPTKLDCAYDTMKEAGFDIRYAKGYNSKAKKTDVKLVADAVSAAVGADIVVIFAGLTDDYESEGLDRTHMNLPECQNELIKSIAAINPNTVVVLAGGSPVSMPWESGVKAILNSYLGGQATASAATDILSGKVNPSGKLAETYPFSNHCTPCRDFFPGTKTSVEHRESIYIGYRFYEKYSRKVLYPFGHGLSYTSFEYSDIKLDSNKIKDSDTLTVSFKIKNTGKADGAEIAQVYVADKESTIFRPVKELKGFKKVFLKAGEETSVSIELSKRSFAFYNVSASDWQVESGEFDIIVAASSADERLKATVFVESTCDAAIPDYRESAPSYYTGDVTAVSDKEFEAILGHTLPPSERDNSVPLDITNNIEDAENTKWGGRIFRTANAATKLFVKGPNAGIASKIAVQTPIRNFVSMSCGLFSEDMAKGLMKILNDDKPGQGVADIAKGIPYLLKNLKTLFKNI